MTAVSDALLDGKRIRAAERRARAIGEITGALARSMKRRGLVTGRPAMTGFRSHIATGLDRRSWLEWKCRRPKRNVGQRRSDRLDGSSGLSGGRTPGEQRRRHFRELRLYTQGLLPRDLLQQFVFTTAAAALPIRFAKSVTMLLDWARYAS